jgi:hypothetical protein
MHTPASIENHLKKPSQPNCRKALPTQETTRPNETEAQKTPPNASHTTTTRSNNTGTVKQQPCALYWGHNVPATCNQQEQQRTKKRTGQLSSHPSPSEATLGVPTPLVKKAHRDIHPM